MAAGFEKSVVMLDMRKILSQAPDAIDPSLTNNLPLASKNSGASGIEGVTHGNSNQTSQQVNGLNPSQNKVSMSQHQKEDIRT